MPEANDMDLLREYEQNGSEAAFAELVQRHINLVYSVAMRHAGITAQAEEITQAVFIILARKAASLKSGTVLEGWLHTTTRLTALSFLRGERRRQFREQEAYMQSTLQESGETTSDATWAQLTPLLDEAVSRLGKKDRDSLVLRFFKGKNIREVAAALEMSEVAAQRRVLRALEKLRKIFAKRGVDSSASAIAENISAHSMQTAPVLLAKSVSATAIAKGSIAAASTMTLVKGTMKTMTWLKLKFAMGVGAVALLAGGAATMAISQTSNSSGLTARQIITDSQKAYAALSSYSDNGVVTEEVGSQTLKTTFNIRLQRPDFYRIEWSQAMGFFTNSGTVWSSGNGNYMMMKNGPNRVKPQKYADMQMALAAATGVSGQASATIPGTFFKQKWGNVLHAANDALENSEDINGVDCYVVSSSMGPSRNQGKSTQKTIITLWIGRKDHLIRQIKTVMEKMSVKLPQMSDAQIRKMLEAENKPATPESIAAMKARLATAMKTAQAELNGGTITFTQTHENISVNQKFSPSDFQKAP